MFRIIVLCMPLLLASGDAAADDAIEGRKVQQQKEPPKAEADRKKEQPQADAEVEMSGMSILGNDEAPKSLVIVPWKSSQLGDMPGLSKLLDDSTQPVDKEVFMRELAYYQIRSISK